MAEKQFAALGVPVRIVIALVAELNLYGFWPAKAPFAELKSYFGEAWREGAVKDDGSFRDRIGMALAA